MMSEILFRGKTDNGNWVEGFYCPCCFGRFPCSPAIISKEGVDNGWWQPEKVIPETVGQYTGLTDKNGKKIFEGDIVKFCTELKEICFVDYGKGKYILRQLKKDKYLSWQSIDIFELFGLEWEVIGNIHDNPELMEGAKQ